MSSVPPVSNDARAMMMFEANKKSVLLAYLFWLFLGWLGAHRFYAGRILSGLVMLMLWAIGSLLAWVVVGYLLLAPLAIWWFIDAFLIPGWINEANSRLAFELGAPVR